VRCGEDLPRSCAIVPAWDEPTPPVAWKIEYLVWRAHLDATVTDEIPQ
jgi:hypothetical protein